MEGSIAAGMLQNTNDPSQVEATCPTSNCTWSPYTTLAFCSSVEDISSKLTLRWAGTAGTANFTVEDSTLNLTQRSDNFHSYHNVYSDGSNFYNFKLFTNPSVGDSSSPGLVAETYLIFQKNLSLPFPDESSSGGAFTVLKGSISMCLQTFQTKALNGSTQTQLVSTHDDQTWQRSATIKEAMFVNIDGVSTGGVFGDSGGPAIWTLANGTNYTATQTTIGLLSLFMRDYLDLNASIGALNDGDNYWYSNAASYLAVDIYGENLSNTDETYAMDGFKARLNNLTVSMTN